MARFRTRSQCESAKNEIIHPKVKRKARLSPGAPEKAHKLLVPVVGRLFSHRRSERHEAKREGFKNSLNV